MRVKTTCLLPKIQVVQPLQDRAKSFNQSKVENANINLARQGTKYCSPKIEKKQSKNEQKEVLNNASKIRFLEDMIEKQIDTELQEEFVRQRELPENSQHSDKQLWANVMINHVQRVMNVLSSLKAQGRINELNSIEGVAKMLGIPETRAFETQYLKKMKKDRSMTSIPDSSIQANPTDGQHLTIGSPVIASPPVSQHVYTNVLNSPVGSRGSVSGDGGLL